MCIRINKIVSIFNRIQLKIMLNVKHLSAFFISSFPSQMISFFIKFIPLLFQLLQRQCNTLHRMYFARTNQT